jgi:hypothetical protein
VGNTYAEQLFKRKYDTAEKVANLALMPQRFLSAVKRSVSPDGESFNSFVQISGGVGWSGTRSGARAVAGQGGGRGNGSFQQIRNSQGCLKGEVSVAERNVKRGNSGDAAALRAMAAAVDGHLEQSGQMLEWMVTCTSRGLAVCSGTISAGVVTITSNAEHINRIRPDMILIASAAAGTSGSALGSGSQGFVIRVGRSGSAPTFTVSATSGGAAGTPTGWTGTMFFFMLGVYAPANLGAGNDNGSDGDTSGFFLDTLDSWCNETAPGATAFKNMDRTVDEVLAGIRLTAAQVANLNILQRIELLAVTAVSRYGWKKSTTKCAYVHTIRFNEANQLLQRTDVREAGYKVTEQGKTKYGYKYIELTSVAGDFRIEEGPMFDPDVCWMTDPGDWTLHSAHGFPAVIDDDGLKWIRDPNTDSYVLQYSGYGSLRTTNPSGIARCPLN